MKRSILPFILAAVILLGSIGGVVLLHKFAPKPKQQPPQIKAPKALYQTAQAETIQLKVYAQGTVQPHTETTLTAEVSGRIVQRMENFENGGFVQKDNVLVQIDPRDYEAGVVRARAEVMRAEAVLTREEAQAEQARQDWETLGEGEPPPLALREPQLKEAQADLESARAALQKAENDLARTSIRAPYDGRIRSTSADLGQFMNAGSQVGQMYAVDYAEIRLPLSDRELSNLDVDETLFRNQPEVTLKGTLAGQTHEWKGRIVRMEGVIDAKSRLRYLIARVNDPYGRETEWSAPLTVGMFVQATIFGKTLENVFKIPRGALHGGNTLYVADDNDQLDIREVDVVSFQNGEVVVQSGIADGERVIVSPLSAVVTGMTLDLEEKVSKE